MPVVVRPLRLLLACLLAVPLLSSCTLVTLRDEARAFYAATVLAGRVAVPAGWRGPVVVAAVAEGADGRRQVVHQVRLHEAGGYELIVPDGLTTVVAFGDADGNGRPDDGDPAALQPAPVDVRSQGLLLQLDLVLAPGQAAALRRALPADAPSPPHHSTQVGAPLRLDEPAFSAEAGRQGYWSPMEAFRRTGGNIYFAEPYDPARTPVLFVHGALGSAQDFAPFLSRLDRRRYQAWVFQYPSGSSLDSMAHLLYWKLFNLQVQHRVERLHIVAHSMGGLVVRRLLLDHGAELGSLVGAFVSLSTPWGGESGAALGVKHSPAVVPSWRDMQPGEAFLTQLYARPLPPSVRHLLLFGHRGGYNLLRPTTDGTVTLASQLRPEAQAEARMVTGFDEDHDSILAAPTVIEHVQALLAAADRPGAMPAGGRLQVRLAAPDGRAESLLAALATLTLTPVGGPDTPRTPQVMSLAPGAGLTRVGPVAPGVYEVSATAPAFRTQPARRRVTVEPGGETALDFTLAPQGTLFGQIDVAGDPLRQPAGSYRAPHTRATVRRIVLQGPGGVRTLVPRRSERPDLLPAFLDDRDDADGAVFSFVNLPAGEFVLTVEADGHAPHVSRHVVMPGRVSPLASVLLQPLR